MYSIVRDRQRVWPYCIECGCRLNVRKYSCPITMTMLHFSDDYVTDKNGHQCAFIKVEVIVRKITSINILNEITGIK